MKQLCRNLRATIVRRINIIGAGGHGAVCADIGLLCGYKEIVFYDDAFIEKPTLLNWKVTNNISWVYNNIQKNEDYAIAIGNNALRQSIFYKLQNLSANIVNLIHPKAIVSSFSRMGQGNVLCAGSFVGVNTTLANVCIINSLSSVDHDCILEDSVHVCPGTHVGGFSSLGQRSWIGIGSAVKQCISIGADAVIGAGAAVVSDVPSAQLYVGVPARHKKDI